MEHMKESKEQANEFRNAVNDRLRSIGNHFAQVMTPLCESYRLTPMQLRVLDEVSQTGPVSIGVLSESVGVVIANLSVLCKRLEKLGYVTRMRNPEDERVVLIELTRLGGEIIDDLQEKIEGAFHTMFDTLSNDEMAGILTSLDTLDRLTGRFDQEE